MLRLFAFLGLLAYIALVVADFMMKSPDQNIRSDMMLIFVGVLFNLNIWLIKSIPSRSSGEPTPDNRSSDGSDGGGGGD